MTDADGNPTDERDSRTNASDADGGRMDTTGLVCSILGVITCGLWLLSIPGLVLSLVAMKRHPSGKAKAGVVLGAIGVAMFILTAPLLIGLLLPSLTTAKRAALMEKNANQMSQIHKAMLEMANSDS